MSDDERAVWECRRELRKIRDALEVIAALLTFAVVAGFGASGLLWPKPAGLWAAGIYLFALVMAGLVVSGIRKIT